MKQISYQMMLIIKQYVIDSIQADRKKVDKRPLNKLRKGDDL